MDKKENIQDNQEQKTENLFTLASQEIEEENKSSLELDKSEEENSEYTNETVSFENLFHTTEKNNNQDTEEQEKVSNELNINDILQQELQEKEDLTATNSLLDPENQTAEPKKRISEEPLNNISPFLQPEQSTEKELSESAKEEPFQTSNPFLEENGQIKEPLLSPDPSAEKKVANPFLAQTNQAEEPLNNTDPFLQQNEEPTEKKLSETTTEETLQTNNKTLDEENITNPFFADTPIKEDNQIDINPFFQNKIEVNEKQKHQNDTKLDLTNVPHYNVKIQKKKPKKLKMVLGVLSYAIFIWLLLIGIALLIYVADIKIKEMKGDYTPPKYNAYVVLSGSMLPKIKVYDVVLTKRIEAEELEEGDIITFASSDERYAGTIITHRIINKYYDSTTGQYTFQTKGDYNNVADSALVEQANIYGKVILKIPKLGYLQLFLASQGGWIIVILIPCAVVISFDIMKLLKVFAQKRKLKIVK